MLDMEKIKTDIVQPLAISVVEILKIQCSYLVEHKPPISGSENLTSKTDIAAVIALSGSDVNGCIALCLPEKVFLALMGGMFGEKPTTINAEIQDGAGELLNIIFGTAKNVWNERGHAVEKAIPTIAIGRDLKLRHLTPIPTIILPFMSPDGEFHMELAINQ